jgi:glycosyltransferase involved in cell wall biosynthesis
MSKVTVDLFGLDPKYVGGVSRFSIGLTSGLINNLGSSEVTIICSSENYSFISSKFNDTPIIEVVKRPFDAYVFAAIAIVAWIFKAPGLLRLSKYYRKSKVLELVQKSQIIVPTSTINFFQLPCAILCIHDIQHELFPENFTVITRAYRWAQYRLSAMHAKRIQVSSEYISDNLKEVFGKSIQMKTVKIYEGFNKNEFSPNLPKSAPTDYIESLHHFIYYPAQLWRHKNHSTVIAGLALFNSTSSFKLTLVLSGRDYGELDNIRDLGLKNNVSIVYLGIVDDIHMRWLYSNAFAVVSAGYHESSSLPIREAIACGGSVLAADIQPNREILFLKSIHLFDTFSPDSFSKSLFVMDESKKSNLRCDSLTSNQWEYFEKTFEWNNVSLKYIEVLENFDSTCCG